MISARWLIASALSTLACGSTGSGLEGRSTLAIVDGEESGAEQDSVVMLRAVAELNNEALCSGTLVAPNLVLTARHCVSYLTVGLFSCTVQGELVERDPNAGKLGRHLPAENIEIFGRETPRSEALARGAQVISTLSPTICVNDLAFVVLDRELDLPIAPLRIAMPANVHEAATLVGYGQNGYDDELEYKTAPRMQRADVDIVGVGPDAVEEVTTVPPRTIMVDGVSGCTGDSGGPLLAASGAVLGVYSLLAGETCVDPLAEHYLTHVPAFPGLTDQAFAAAGYEPIPEPDRTPSTSAGAGGGKNEAGSGASEPSDPSAGGGGGEATSDDGEPSDGPRKPDSSCAVAPPHSASHTLVALSTLALATLAQRRRRSQRRPSSGSA